MIRYKNHYNTLKRICIKGEKVMENREQWTTKSGFILAAAGSAIGLGNIWRFPFLVGENGGAAFVFIYLFFIIFIGLFLMIGEIAIGRQGKANVFDSYKKIKPNSNWHIIGSMGVLLNFVILSFYSVVSGWSLYYLVKSITDLFKEKSSEINYQLQFEQFIADPISPVLYQGLLMMLVIWIVMSGVKNGIERWNNFLMPTLFLLLFLLAIRSLFLSGSSEGLSFFLNPDFSKINGQVILTALGQAFFSLGLASGMYVTYGSYLKDKSNIPLNSVGIIFFDTLVAILAGIIIFPAVFSYGIDPAGGPGLVFITFPMIFADMAFGEYYAILFFFFIFVAAFTSAISLLEVVSNFIEEKFLITRKKATLIMGFVVFIVGIPNTLSFGVLSNVKFLGNTIFSWFDIFSSNILMPLSGLLLSIFLGWIWTPEKVKEEIEKEGVPFPFFRVWRFFLQYIIPVSIFLVFIQNILGLKF